MNRKISEFHKIFLLFKQIHQQHFRIFNKTYQIKVQIFQKIANIIYIRIIHCFIIMM